MIKESIVYSCSCSCVNIEVGSYGNQVELPRPPQMIGRKEGSESDTICVDRCISEEVQYLWSLGISTTGCCCGHNRGNEYPHIGVIDSDIEKMNELGYVVQPNNLYPERQDAFIPKSVQGMFP